MFRYFLRRLFLIPLTLLGIMAVNFLFVQLAPGGPVEHMIAKLQDGGAASRIGGFSVGITPFRQNTAGRRGWIPL